MAVCPPPAGTAAASSHHCHLARPQLVLPVVSYGCEVWGAQHQHFTERAYFDTNPGEAVHLAFLRWYTGASPKALMCLILAGPTSCRCSSTGCRVPAALEQAGHSRPRLLAGSSGLRGECADVAGGQQQLLGRWACLPPAPPGHRATPQLWTKTFEPAVAEANMSAITAHNWDCLSRHALCRDLCRLPDLWRG